MTKGGVQLYLAADGRFVNPPDKDLGTIIQNAYEAWQAEDYVKNLTVNVTRGWKSIMDKAANGRVLTRNVPTWLKVIDRIYNGGKIINPGRIVEVPEKVAIVQEIYRLAGQGVGSENIARLLGKRLTRPNGKNFTRSWIVKTLCNRAVLGEFELKNGEVIPGYFPPIIDQSDFDAARQQMEAKRKNGKYAGGNRKHSDTADDIIHGLVFDDDTVKPEGRKMYYHPVARGRYFVSSPDGLREIHRVRYDKVANKVVHTLETMKREDWLAIRGMSESAEYLAAKAEYEATKGELDRVTRRIEEGEKAMNAKDITAGAMVILSNKLSKDGEVRDALQARLDELKATLDAATKRSAALYQDEELRAIIREVKANPDMRMRLRTEIQKRVARIELKFNPGQQIDSTIEYVNGAKRQFMIE